MTAFHNGKPIIMDDEDAFGADRARVNPEGRDGEALLHQCCSDLGVNFATAVQIVAWADENLSAREREGGGGGFHAWQHSLSLEKLARLMVGFENARLGNRLLLFALNHPALDDVIAHGYPASFARQFGCTRANAIKLLGYIQSELGLPIRPGQKSPHAREKMRTQRNQQLK